MMYFVLLLCLSVQRLTFPCCQSTQAITLGMASTHQFINPVGEDDGPIVPPARVVSQSIHLVSEDDSPIVLPA